MNRDRAIEKLKKCLRLAQSSNPHEAAAALRQAQALMREYGLSEQDACDRDPPRQSAASTGSRAEVPPIQMQQLAILCADVFGCQVVMTPERRGWSRVWHASYFGIGAAPTVAAYSFTVLRRQLERDTRQHLRRVRKAVNRRGRAARFGVGWVSAVERIVHPTPIPEDDQRAIQALINRTCGSLITGSPRLDDLKAGAVTADDYSAGFERGLNAQLHRGVDGASAPIRRLAQETRT